MWGHQVHMIEWTGKTSLVTKVICHIKHVEERTLTVSPNKPKILNFVHQAVYRHVRAGHKTAASLSGHIEGRKLAQEQSYTLFTCGLG